MRSRTALQALFTLGASLVFLSCGAPEEVSDEFYWDDEPEAVGDATADESALSVTKLRVQTFVKTTEQLNLRAGPGSQHPVVKMLAAKVRVFVQSGPHNARWYRVEHRNSVGYVHGAYLAPAPAKLVSKLPTTDKIVALTFDAGADRGYAASILDTLKNRGVKASFGMTGKWAQAHPALVQRMHNEGHHIFNHTYSHSSFTGFSSGKSALTYAQRMEELSKTNTIIRDITGAGTRPMWRPPYGDYDAAVLENVYGAGYFYQLMWSCDSLGWKGLTREQITQRVLDFLEPGAVYLFHVGAQSQDGPALGAIIRELRARGYTFARMNDLKL